MGGQCSISASLYIRKAKIKIIIKNYNETSKRFRVDALVPSVRDVKVQLAQSRC